MPISMRIKYCFFHGDSPGKNTGKGYHFLLQGIFPTQGSNPRLLRWQADSLLLRHPGSLLEKLGDVRII